ncbi:hypothetical protein ACKI1Q_27445 [Streptomyces galilaeus]|uniref:hypothetical protein n=1 Tax=Streptomyces galilaeus TaxID=33899 RepID=UPI0038F7EFFB
MPSVDQVSQYSSSSTTAVNLVGSSKAVCLRTAVTDAGTCCALATGSGRSTFGARDCASRACALFVSLVLLRNHDSTNGCA